MCNSLRMLHHHISRGPQSPRLLRAASFSAATPSNKGVCGFSFASLFRGKETAFGSRNGGGKHAFSSFVSYAVVISPRLFGYDMVGDLKRWRTRLFLPFSDFSKHKFCLQNAVLSGTPWSVLLRQPCHSLHEPPTTESSLWGQKNAAGHRCPTAMALSLLPKEFPKLFFPVDDIKKVRLVNLNSMFLLFIPSYARRPRLLLQRRKDHLVLGRIQIVSAFDSPVVACILITPVEMP
jgi:hypothetical protein